MGGSLLRFFAAIHREGAVASGTPTEWVRALRRWPATELELESSHHGRPLVVSLPGTDGSRELDIVVE